MILSTILFLSFQSVSSSIPNDQILHVPLTQPHSNEDIAKLISERILKREKTEILKGNDDKLIFGYRGIVSVGTPPQNFSILFDTGSTQLWIKSKSCPTCISSNLYNSSASSTFKPVQTSASPIRYFDGTFVNGILGNDAVTVAGVKLDNFTFQQAVDYNDKGQIDGIMGLGFSPKIDQPTFWSQVLDSQSSMSPIFSYYIDSTGTSGGLTFGALDRARFSGNLSIEEVAFKTGPLSAVWTVFVKEIKGVKAIPIANLKAIIDTGTSLTVLPKDLAKAINENLGLSELGSGLYGMKCDDGIPRDRQVLEITLENTVLRFRSDDYLFPVTISNGTYCVSGILGRSLNSDLIIIGNILLRRYYTVFDQVNRLIGFAVCNRKVILNSSFTATDLKTPVEGTANLTDELGDIQYRNSVTRRSLPALLIMSISTLSLLS